MPVPIAIIVCEGDLETIAHISKALEKKLPVIIMKGSGMAADLVLDYLDKYVKLYKIFKRMADCYPTTSACQLFLLIVYVFTNCVIIKQWVCKLCSKNALASNRCNPSVIYVIDWVDSEVTYFHSLVYFIISINVR